MSLSLKQTDSQRTNLWLPREQGSGEGRIGSLGLVDANYVYAKSLQACPALCDHLDYSPPGSSICETLQARILGWVAMPSSRRTS